MRPALVPAKWVPSTSAFVVAAAASSARLVGVHRIGKPGVDDELHGIGERGCVRRIACVRTAFDVAGAEQVAGAGERRDPFSVEQARVSADMIDVQVGADDEIDCVSRNPAATSFVRKGRCWWSNCGISGLFFELPVHVSTTIRRSPASTTTGKAMTCSTTRVIRTPSTSHDIVPTLLAGAASRLFRRTRPS